MWILPNPILRVYLDVLYYLFQDSIPLKMEMSTTIKSRMSVILRINVSQLPAWLVAWLVARLVAWLLGWSVYACRILTAWMVAWLIARLVAWLVAWAVLRLQARPTHGRTRKRPWDGVRFWLRVIASTESTHSGAPLGGWPTPGTRPKSSKAKPKIQKF